MNQEIRRITGREFEVVRLAAEGLCDKEIAKELSISTGSVRTYWTRLREKTSARNRTQAVCLSLKLDEIHRS